MITKIIEEISNNQLKPLQETQIKLDKELESIGVRLHIIEKSLNTLHSIIIKIIAGVGVIAGYQLLRILHILQ